MSNTSQTHGAARQGPVGPDDLRLLIAQLGLSQERFARAIGMSPRGLAYYLSGERPIPGPVRILVDILWDHRVQRGLLGHNQRSMAREIARQRGDPPWWDSPDPASHPDTQP